jgi:pyrroloquinoline quinone biosynthesis protein B
MNANGIQLHASESLANLIRRTPSWNLMAHQGVFDIEIFNTEQGDQTIKSSTLQIEHVPIPHRAELSDMFGFIIRGPCKSLFFLPDQDTWEQTLSAHKCTSIRQFLQGLRVNIALIDGTFWSSHELGNLRDQTQVPHPPVSETLDMLGNRLPQDPEIFFTHLNHTNPLYDSNSAQYRTLYDMGWEVAWQGMKFDL